MVSCRKATWWRRRPEMGLKGWAGLQAEMLGKADFREEEEIVATVVMIMT